MKSISFRKALLTAVTASTVLFAAASAQATTTINITKITQDAGAVSGKVGYDAPATTIWDLFKPDQTVSTGAGRFTLTGTDMSTNTAVSYQSYCVDLFQDLSTGKFQLTSLSTILDSYSPTVAATKADQLNALIANGNALVTNATTSAAMQLAVWEVLYDYSSVSSYTLDKGEFYAFTSSASFNSASDLANTYLGNVTSGVWKSDSSYTLSVLSSDKLQDQLVFTRSTVSPVPEPATWAMMLVGFGTVGGALRRRRTGALGVQQLG